MTRNPAGSFFARMRKKLFKWRIDQEAYDRIAPHLQGEKDHGYPFNTAEQMNAMTEEFSVQALFDSIERQTRRMPKSYGRSFRYIVHRDLYQRLKMYEQVARVRVQPDWCDPRLIATHA